jgi:nicotinamidase-related amidase
MPPNQALQQTAGASLVSVTSSSPSLLSWVVWRLGRGHTKEVLAMMGTFAPSDSALLLIDHQVGTMKLIKNIPLEVVKRNTLALAKTAKILGIPVVLTSSQEQNVQGALLPELQGILPEAFTARIKRAGIVNAWNDPNFKAAVEKMQRRNLIMAGVTTDVCLVYPAISACREGYQVQAVMDASGSPYDISEEMSRRRMEREGVVLTATNTLMAELAQDWSRPEGGQLLGILFQDVLPSID